MKSLFLTKLTAIASVLTSSLIGAFAGQKVEQRAELRVGDEAPDFKLPGSDGKTYRLSEFRNKKIVVLAWFPKAFTPGCTRECRAFAQQADAFEGLPVAYFTVSADTPEDNKRFAESLKAQYPILSDPTRQTALAYGVLTNPQGFAQRWTFIIGPDGKILHIDKQVKVDSHARDVADWIRNWLQQHPEWKPQE
ncbi:peroxiredoxin [Thermogutta sp.]|uniref:peroxiredoxin n=1 Tax=Thermogutta sp. TaxID=1962930 RepID=UPI003C7C6185